MTSRIDDIDPNSIERIEVLKGAAAATLYGTEASNGVMQIFTKKGSSGRRGGAFSSSRKASPSRIGSRLTPGTRERRRRPIAWRTFWRKPGSDAFQVFEVPIFKDLPHRNGQRDRGQRIGERRRATRSRTSRRAATSTRMGRSAARASGRRRTGCSASRPD